MKNLTLAIRRSLSTRLSLCVVGFVAVLYMVALLLMFYYARTAVKKEALAKSEAALDGMILKIDNHLREVEKASDNTLCHVMQHLDNPADLQNDTRRMLETNHKVVGCAVALDPAYSKEHHFQSMYCSYRGSDSISISDHFGNIPYTEQEWYTRTMTSGQAGWSDPTIENLRGGYPVMGYSIPIKSDGRLVGVFVAAISLEWLSRTIEEARPFPNTYCSLINQSGAYLIHPDSTYLHMQTVHQQLEAFPDENMQRLADNMLGGKSGYMSVNIYDIDCYVFYKPYRNTGWAANIVSPKNDVFSTYHRLQKHMIAVIAVGLLVLLVYGWHIIHFLLRPLRFLDISAHRLANGHFDEPISDSYRKDEIGALQKSFRAMQRSLGRYLTAIEQRRTVLGQQNEALHAALDKVYEADRLKSVFVHNMTDQMIKPVTAIESLVTTIHDEHSRLNHEEVVEIVSKMSKHTKVVTQLLDRTIEVSLRKQTEVEE